MNEDLVSVVIPTRNRQESLRRVLHSLSGQNYPISKIYLVDASDEKQLTGDILFAFDNLPIEVIHSEASVCIQRNKGIKRCKTPYIFLCDDDIEVPDDYISCALQHFSEHPETIVVSGIWLQLEDGHWVSEYPVHSLKALISCYISQTSIWGNISSFHVPGMLRPLYKLIKTHYQKRMNTFSLAGWPLITDFSGPIFSCTFYSLGSAVIKSKYLINNLYDDVLDPYGIGDNYGLAAGFPQDRSIRIIKDLQVFHHREAVNRIERTLAYYRRVLALHYFLTTKDRFRFRHRLWLMWSLFVSSFFWLIKGELLLLKANMKALVLIWGRNNPYLLGKKNETKIVCPRL